MADIYGSARKTSPGINAAGGRQLAELTRDGALFTAPWLYQKTLQGKVFRVGGAAPQTSITGQTSYADTTPTFHLSIPVNYFAVLLGIYLQQTGTVAGGAIDINGGLSLSQDAYASGGSAVVPYPALTGAGTTSQCTFRTGATATTAKLTTQFWSFHAGQDVSAAEGADDSYIWTPEKFGPLIVGSTANATSIGIFTSAGTTGPTWYYQFVYLELLASEVAG